MFVEQEAKEARTEKDVRDSEGRERNYAVPLPVRFRMRW